MANVRAPVHAGRGGGRRGTVPDTTNFYGSLLTALSWAAWRTDSPVCDLAGVDRETHKLLRPAPSSAADRV